MMRLTEEKMWQATVSSDSCYDKVFYYAVKTTGVFCKPSCKSRTPNRENVRFFQSVPNARAAGFRPCKRCCPDQVDERYEGSAQMVEEAKAFIHQRFQNKLTLTDMAKQMGVSAYHFNRVFKEKTGETPRQYLEKVRVRKAQNLLMSTSLSVTEIGYCVGFQSLSSFYAAFQRRKLDTPTSLREEAVKWR